MVATEHILNAHDSYVYKREYDAAYLARDFHRIEHMRLFEPGRLPTHVVSALFSLDNIVVGDDVARVALNVYPSDYAPSSTTCRSLPYRSRLARMTWWAVVSLPVFPNGGKLFTRIGC